MPCILYSVVVDANSSKARRRGRSGSPRRSKPQADASNTTLCLAGEGAGRHPERPALPKKGSGREKISIELSKAQVNQVVGDAGQGGTMSVLLSALRDPDWTLALDSEDWVYPAQMEDRRLSHSLLSGLLILSCFSLDREDLGVAELARMLRMTTSTTHRYVTTLLAVGLLEQDSTTRRYRLATT